MVEDSKEAYPVFAGYKRVETPDGFLGNGNWGEVLLYEGAHGNRFAVKRHELTHLAQEQKATRGWDDERLVRNDSLNGETRSLPGLAFRFVNYDTKGNPYLFIEPIDRFLVDHIEGRTLTPAEATPIMRGISTGLNSLHTHIQRIHGDLHPKNIGYPSDGLVKIFDFGSSTDGDERIENLGHPLVRAPERFFKDRIRPASDVWSFGAILYRMFAQEFPLQEPYEGIGGYARTEKSLTSAEDFERFISERFITLVQSYYTSPTTWNDIINGKIRRLNTPKAFKELLGNTLCHESSRIPNGAALEEEVARTIRKYEKTLWPSKARRCAGLALALAATIGIGYAAINQRTEKQGLEIKLEKSQQEIRLGEKIQIIKAYTGERFKFPDNYYEYALSGSLEGWLDMFEDPLTGVAAYLDAEPYPSTIARAMHMAQGKKDWESLKVHIHQINEPLYYAMFNLTAGGVDNFCFRIHRDLRAKVKDRWKEAEKRFQAEESRFAKAERDHTAVNLMKAKLKMK